MDTKFFRYLIISKEKNFWHKKYNSFINRAWVSDCTQTWRKPCYGRYLSSYGVQIHKNWIFNDTFLIEMVIAFQNEIISKLKNISSFYPFCHHNIKLKLFIFHNTSTWGKVFNLSILLVHNILTIWSVCIQSKCFFRKKNCTAFDHIIRLFFISWFLVHLTLDVF